MAWQGPPDMNGVKAEEPWRSVVAHQHIPNGLRQQVHLYYFSVARKVPQHVVVPGQNVPG